METIRELEDTRILEQISKMMEEMAGAPREDYGKRQPGERGMYERYSSVSERE